MTVERTPRRVGCTSANGATVVVYRAFGSGTAESASRGDLLVRWLFQ